MYHFSLRRRFPDIDFGFCDRPVPFKLPPHRPSQNPEWLLKIVFARLVIRLWKSRSEKGYDSLLKNKRTLHIAQLILYRYLVFKTLLVRIAPRLVVILIEVIGEIANKYSDHLLIRFASRIILTKVKVLVGGAVASEH